MSKSRSSSQISPYAATAGTNSDGLLVVAGLFLVAVFLHSGIVRLNGDELREGDGAAIVDEPKIVIDTAHRGELLLFVLE